MIGTAEAPQPSTLRWFPVVGATVGLVVGTVWWGADRLWPPLVAAVLAVVADLATTGLLHVDGLADSADGLLGPLSRARRLEVMAAPDVGAFGVTAVAVVLVARVAGLDVTKPAPLLIAGLWCASRTLMAAAATVLPYARPGGGLASAFRSDAPTARAGRNAAPLVGGALAAVVLAAVGSGGPGVVAVVCAVVAGIAVLAFAQRRLGGFTGDVLGAAGMIAESAGLVVAGARW
ncbi:MAG: adenosylcobinamide-GDP ribazoletransferase [Actinomycetota bacterium]|nr:adenosylcobinamide-GDP ribazoletransferase [Actinomycetota bacterium]